MPVETLQHMSKFLNPLFLVDMMVKTAILFTLAAYISSGLDHLFSKVLPYFKDKASDDEKLKKWVQVLVQIAVCAPIAFLFRTIIEYLGNRFDFLDEVMSSLSAKGASLIAGLAFFLNQKKLKVRMASLSSTALM